MNARPLAARQGLAQTRRMTIAFRLLLPVLLLAVVSACGFQLRKPLQLPPDLDGIRVVASDPYSPLAQALSRSLEHAGLEVAEGAADAGAGDAGVLRIHSEGWDSQAISVDEFGRAQEFTLRYAAVFSLVGADGTELVPEQVIELSREYVSLPENSTGSESEREMLSRELQREMSAAVLRRIDAVNRARIRDDAAATPSGD